MNLKKLFVYWGMDNLQQITVYFMFLLILLYS